jgi:hypothetical protein
MCSTDLVLTQIFNVDNLTVLYVFIMAIRHINVIKQHKQHANFGGGTAQRDRPKIDNGMIEASTREFTYAHVRRHTTSGRTHAKRITAEYDNFKRFLSAVFFC